MSHLLLPIEVAIERPEDFTDREMDSVTGLPETLHRWRSRAVIISILATDPVHNVLKTGVLDEDHPAYAAEDAQDIIEAIGLTT